MKLLSGHRLFIGLLLFTGLNLGMAQANNFTMGLQAYQSKQWATAAEYFRRSVAETPQDASRHYYLGMALAQNRASAQAAAAEQFKLAYALAPKGSVLAQKAQSNLANLARSDSFLALQQPGVNRLMPTTGTRPANNQTSHQATPQAEALKSKLSAARLPASTLKREDQYLSHSLSQGKVAHWDLQRMPLRVYITPGQNTPGWYPEANQAITYAMETWKQATRGKVRFMLTRQAQQADIVVRWKSGFGNERIGENPFESRNNTIVRSDVTLALTYGSAQTPLSLKTLQTTALHEFGHALGIQGHSPYPEDIMYAAANHAQSGQLTTRDVKTIQLLYKIDADVQNDSRLSATQSKQYYDLLQSGSSLAQQGQYSKALQIYQQAASLNPNDVKVKSLIGAVLINQGVAELKQNNVGQARQHFAQAVQVLQQASNLQQSRGQADENIQTNLKIAQQNLQAVSG